MIDWVRWHQDYDRTDSSLSRRLSVVRRRIAEALDRCPAGPIRVVSMCAGDGRDLLGVLESHRRAGDVSARLVELDERLAKRARALAPSAIEVSCRDAGRSDAYEGAVPADLILCCGVFGNVSGYDIRSTVGSWPMLCAPGATVIWTRGASVPDRREEIRRWTTLAGFEEVEFDGPPEEYGVGVVKMVRESIPYRRGVRFFSFRSGSRTPDASV